MSKYSNTLFYKISCKDNAITDLYVGHTINFVQRQLSHEQSSKSNTCKLYEIIRKHGGWSNWKMEIIGFFNCANHTEARMKEQEFYLSLNANLNSVEPFPNKKEKKVKEDKKEEMEEEAEEEEKEENGENIVNEPSNYRFNCLFCNITCNRKNDWDRHMLTRKHLHKQTNTNKNIKNTFICGFCNKEYKSRKGLWSHNKTCNSTTQNNINKNNINSDTKEFIHQDKDKLLETLIKENTEYKKLFSHLIQEFLSKNF